MNKKMRELMAKREKLLKEAQEAMDADEKDLTSLNAKMDEVDAIDEEIATEKRIFDAQKKQAPKAEDQEKEDPAEKGEQQKAGSIKAFADAARKHFKVEKGLNESADEDGGYTVPEDIVTRVQQYRDTEFCLLELVDVENVTTNKGSRTYQKRGDTEGFVEVNEDGEITEIEAPKFERISYAIKDYAGFLPVTNQLLDDSDENITNTITQWMGTNSRATANRLILAALKTKETKEIDGLNGIKTVLNTELGQTFKPTSVIVTNDDGLNYLDTLTDTTGRPLLNPDPTDSAKIQLRSGATVVPVKALPNKVLATKGNMVPFIIGDLKEAVKFWSRKQLSIMASNVASVGATNAFAQNLTMFRAIEREDVTLKDQDAYVMCAIKVDFVAQNEATGDNSTTGSKEDQEAAG